MSKQKILLIDDDQNFLDDLQLFLNKDYHCVTENSLQSGREEFLKNNYDLIVLDIHFGGRQNGIDLLKEIRSNDSITPVIMVTRKDDIDTVVTAMKAGANDYLNKPIKFKEFLLRLQKVQNELNLIKENISLKEQLQTKQIPFFGKSPRIQKIKQDIQNIAKLSTPVLISGETGVGKEIAARAIHRQSERRDKPFYVINCSAIPENLIESELFGHEKGAFTGALNSVTGKFKQADGSTLLIDEIGDLSLSLQTKLLNVLETQQFYPLGSSELIQTDIRFLFATNADLTQKIRDKEFREDLFYRINVLQIEIPPLRRRPQDIELLVDYYLSVFSQLHGKEGLSVSDEAIDYLKAQPWPGNIRQLKNTLERAVIFCSTEQIEMNDLDIQNISEIDVDTAIHLDYNSAKLETLHKFQRTYINAYLEQTNGSITKAARLMGLPRPSLQRMIKELGL
ncbi:MAG: sigma-54 dependent transcriptional regulator [Calditrichales bacterium]|nr:sigma-54 dependent transcriptional regulator [Calditrichales bacterium]